MPPTSNQRDAFQLYGDQNPPSGQQAFNDYETGEGWKHYVIAIADYQSLIGNYDYLVFVADDDASSAADSWFRDVRIYEADETTQEVDYAYDAQNQLINREVDPDGTATAEDIEQTFFLWENGQIALQFDKTGTGDVEIEDLSHRYLWGPVVDQALADEVVNSLTDAQYNETLWLLTDHLGTPRDIIDDTATVLNHITYDSFGQVTAETGSTRSLFNWEGHPYDVFTLLVLTDARPYDPGTGSFLTHDPSGFPAGYTSLYVYAGNKVTSFTDPDGRQEQGSGSVIDGIDNPNASIWPEPQWPGIPDVTPEEVLQDEAEYFANRYFASGGNLGDGGFAVFDYMAVVGWYQQQRLAGVPKDCFERIITDLAAEAARRYANSKSNIPGTGKGPEKGTFYFFGILGNLARNQM